MSTHTPGPWHISNGVQIRSEQHQIAKVWMMRNGEGKANAHLIAAAPDLLTLCETCLRVLYEDEHPSLRQALREAIAKAQGANVVGEPT